MTTMSFLNRNKIHGRPRMQLAGLLGLVAVAAAGCGASKEATYPSNAVIELSDQFTGQFTLIDQNGAPFSTASIEGRIGVVYFGFASCPDVCPLALGTLSAALNEFSEPERADFTPIFISVDPERDTPETIKAFLSFDSRIVGVTGNEEASRAAREAFKVYAQKRPLEDSEAGYVVDHSSLFYVVDRAGSPRIAVKDSVSPQELAAILRESLAW